MKRRTTKQEAEAQLERLVAAFEEEHGRAPRVDECLRLAKVCRWISQLIKARVGL